MIKKTLLENLEKRRAAARLGGGADKLAARRKKGIMTARERIEKLFQPGTFLEQGLLTDHDCHRFDMEKKTMPGDGVIVGSGMADGRPVAAFSQDFTVGGGALGRIHSEKICKIMDHALKTGCPVVGFNDSGGANSGGRRLARGLWPRVFSQRPFVRGRSADRSDCRSVRRGRGVFAGIDGLHHYGQEYFQHVHLRAGSHSGCHRPEMHNGGNRRRDGQRERQRQYSFCRRQ